MDMIQKKIKDIQTFLKVTYGIVPIVAGADKFTNLLASWVEYLNPALAAMLPISNTTFMMIVGVIEVAAGILVLLKPKIGALVVCGWLIAIALTLFASGKYLDVAVRDVVMATGAFAFAQLTSFLSSYQSKAS
jgi:uncharacterized membrane protein YphA (DoxX/SURF4 family)